MVSDNNNYINDDYLNSWEDEREAALSELKAYRKKKFQQFMEEVDYNFHDDFFYDMSYKKHTCTIYTTNPGLWIGPNGDNISILTAILSSDGMHWDVEIKEIKGTFLSL